MKRSLTPIFALALLLAFTAGSAFPRNKASNKADAVVKTDADKTDAMVKAGTTPSPDKSDKLDGNELALSCKAEVQGFDAGYCLGVVEGVMASMRLCKQDHSVITLGEAADAMEEYLSSHPDKLNERDVVLARKALSKAYPCGPLRQ
jgi:Rap1a immunity proteins